jgi:hypothetical protein|tara:strand:- start:835 stop:1032 length:198 start_codon:yes stop_codon:yes gene_type:complete
MMLISEGEKRKFVLSTVIITSSDEITLLFSSDKTGLLMIVLNENRSRKIQANRTRFIYIDTGIDV